MLKLDSNKFKMQLENLDYDASNYRIQTDEYKGDSWLKCVMNSDMLPLGLKRVEI